MKVSELSAAAGVSVPTIKFYLRKGLLPAGERTSATQARYGEAHVARLRLVRALTDVGGLSLAATRRLLAALDEGDVTGSLGTAQAALLPEPPGDDGADDVDVSAAAAAVRRLGWVDPGERVLRPLAVAIRAVEEAGLPLSDERLAVYGEAAGLVADHDIAGVPTTGVSEAVTYAVVGTVLYEPVLLALRRLAHADRAVRAADPGTDGRSPVT